MICVSIAEKTAEKCIEALKGIDFAEVRLDKMSIDLEDVKKIFSRHPKLIATCRPGALSEKKRKSLLVAAITAGAAFVDIEVDSDDRYKNEIIQKARSHSCQVIISFHNFVKTPERSELEHIINWCFESRADMVKIACKIHSQRDNARLLGLLNEIRPLIIVGMGDEGKIIRVVAPLLGSAFTYTSLAVGKETAEGQMDRDSLKNIFKRLKNV